MTPIDLATGRVKRAPGEAPAPSARPASAGKSIGGAASAARESTAQKAEKELRERLENAIGRIAAALEARGEDELSAALSEDSGKMAQSLVALTRRFVGLLKVLVWLLSIVEPVLAFGRVVRIMFGKLTNWRQARTEPEDETVPSPNGVTVI
jgi:hypothetical protein